MTSVIFLLIEFFKPLRWYWWMVNKLCVWYCRRELKCPSAETLTFPRITEPFPPLFHAIKEGYIDANFGIGRGSGMYCFLQLDPTATPHDY
jgi:hypothetical protein